MMRLKQTRAGPSKRAMLALTVSLSKYGDVGGHRQDIGVATPEGLEEEYSEEDTSTPPGQAFTSDLVGGLRRSERALNHKNVRTIDEDGGSFRLRLYWEDGYFWQEYKEEMWWCMRELRNLFVSFIIVII